MQDSNKSANESTHNNRPENRPAIWDVGEIHEVTKGNPGTPTEDNVVWGTEPMIFVDPTEDDE